MTVIGAALLMRAPTGLDPVGNPDVTTKVTGMASTAALAMTIAGTVNMTVTGIANKERTNEQRS
jgi:hypothetical protein